MTLLRTSNSALRDQLSSVQDNAKLVVSLQEQLDSATAKNSTDQIAASIASFNCQRAEATVQSQLHPDDKTASENLLRNQCETAPPPTAQSMGQQAARSFSLIQKFVNSVQEATGARHGQESYLVGIKRQRYRRPGSS